MHVERLRALSAHLRTLPENKFDLRYWFGDIKDINVPAECGTTACIGGWALKLWAPDIKVSRYEIRDTAAGILGLNNIRADRLFEPASSRDLPPGMSRETITPTQAADVIDHLIETGEVDWMILA